MKVKKEQQKGRFEGGWKKERDLYLNDMYLNKDTNLKLKSQTLYGVFFFFFLSSLLLFYQVIEGTNNNNNNNQSRRKKVCQSQNCNNNPFFFRPLYLSLGLSLSLSSGLQVYIKFSSRKQQRKS